MTHLPPALSLRKNLLRAAIALATVFATLSTALAAGDLRIGVTAGITGPVSASVTELLQGARLYLDDVNRNGGVAGRKIALETLDDGFDPKRAGENARMLIEEKNVLALFLSRGTPHTEAIMPLLQKHHVPLVAPSTGAMLLHHPVNPYIFNVRPTYQVESHEIVRQFAQLGLTRIGVLFPDDSFGADAFAGAMNGFNEAKLKPLFAEKFDRVKPVMTPYVQTAIKTQAQAVLVIGTQATVAEFVKSLRAAGSSAQVATLSNNASGGFVRMLGHDATGIIVTQVFPSERTGATAMSREAQTLAKKANIAELTPAMMEGFAAAKVLVQGLRRAGPNPTRDSLRKGLETMSDFELGGVVTSYSPTDHSGVDYVEMSVIAADGRFRR